MKFNRKNVPSFLYKIYDTLHLTKNSFFNRFSINNSKTSLSCNPFFIIGSGRSGNTLLRAVLVNHPKLSIPPESYVLGNMVRKYQTFNFLPWEDLIKIIVGELESHEQFFTWEINLSPVYQRLLDLESKDRTLAKIIDVIYSYYADQKSPGWEIWGDKTPLNTLRLGWLDKVFDHAKYIHIIRDGRDVVSSYLKMGRYDSIEEAGTRWEESIKLARKLGSIKSDKEYMEIKYENFVSTPEVIIKKVCAFLSINFRENMLNHREKVDELGDVGKLSHHSNLSSPINTDSIGKWRRDLFETQQEEIEKLLEKSLKKLKYK